MRSVIPLQIHNWRPIFHVHPLDSKAPLKSLLWVCLRLMFIFALQRQWRTVLRRWTKMKWLMTTLVVFWWMLELVLFLFFIPRHNYNQHHCYFSSVGYSSTQVKCVDALPRTVFYALAFCIMLFAIIVAGNAAPWDGERKQGWRSKGRKMGLRWMS